MTESFDLYLSERAKWLELNASLFRKKEEYEFVVRLACTLRIFDPQIAKIVTELFYKQEPVHQTLLAEQLSFNPKKGINSFGRTPHYVATGALNISRQSFSQKQMPRGFMEFEQGNLLLTVQ